MLSFAKIGPIVSVQLFERLLFSGDSIFGGDAASITSVVTTSVTDKESSYSVARQNRKINGPQEADVVLVRSLHL